MAYKTWIDESLQNMDPIFPVEIQRYFCVGKESIEKMLTCN
jgi:hypothetical protein